MEGALQHRDRLSPRHVVVGVDGSAESLSALDWAAHAVGAGGVVHAVSVLSPGLELAAAAVQYDSAKLVTSTMHDLESNWVAHVRERGHEVECTVLEDDAVDGLLRTAHEVDADLLAVGIHAKPALGPRTIGRIATKLVHQTDLPLVIVRAGAAAEAGIGNTVVAGAGHGAATHAAVKWAASYAERCGTALSLIRAVPHRPVFGTDGLLDVAAFYIDPKLLLEWATEDLIGLAEEIQESTASELAISRSVKVGEPGRRLVEAGIDAALIVVGRHGGTIQPTLHHVLTHAPCPVVVVPPPDSED